MKKLDFYVMKRNCFKHWKVLAALIVGLFLLMPTSLLASGQGRMVILPFRIHSLQPLDHLKKGLQDMLVTRMHGKGFETISSDQVNKHPMAFLPLFELRDIFAIGRDLKADWVISGSLTQIGRKISIDLKVVDISGKKSPFSIFMVDDNIDNLAGTTERASESVYNQIIGVLQIDAIHVEGNKRIESEAILAVLESKKGDSLDPDKLDKDLRAVFRMGFFMDVKIRTEDGPKGKIVIFTVQEKPSIANIGFEGNDKIDDEDLKNEAGIRQYSILNRNEIRLSISRLVEIYKQKGYYNIKISEKIAELPNNEVSLIYNIDEGKKVYVTKIEFVGNSKYDDDDLKELMETSEKGFFSWFTQSGLLDKQKLEFDLHKISAFYHNNGYIKAKTGAPKISFDEDRGLSITIEIIEGQQYKVNNVDIGGDLIKPAKDLLKETQIKKETFYNREIVRKDSLKLREAYADEGYAYVSVAPLIKEDDENHQVDITYKISKGAKVRFERINITGNTVTRDKVIRRELKVIEGDYFTGDGMKKSTRNLHKLGYFEDVEVKTRKGSQDDLMVLDINVKERPTGSFSMGAGYSSFESAIASFQVSQNNLFGMGQKLALGVNFGGRTKEIDLKFTEPWLFDKPLSAGVDVYKFKRKYVEFTKDSLGGALRFGFPFGFDEFTRASTGYYFDDADIQDIDDDAALQIKEMEGRNITSSIRLGIKRDTKDRPWYTTKGSVNNFNFEYAGGFLGGDVSFNKYTASTEWYFPFRWETVLLTKGSWGYVAKRSDEKLPTYQKFRIGGINSVRGFEFLSISPKDPATGDRIGGEKMMYYNFEYRFPFIKEQGVMGLVFFDAGNVFTKDESFTFSGIRRSVGAGIRWYSPVGPLRLEYGKNLDPLRDESSGKVEIGMGGLF